MNQFPSPHNHESPHTFPRSFAPNREVEPRSWRHPGTNRMRFTVTNILIGVNLVLFLLMVVHGTLAGVGLRDSLISPPTPLLLTWGGQFWPAVLEHGQWWRCLTYAFAHVGIIHLGFNMVVLFQIGPLVESAVGRSRFIILYTATILTSTLLGYAWHPMAPVAGASGALFGLIGYSAVFFHRLGPSGHPVRNVMLQWALFAFLFGFMVHADNAGHLGGALGGFALAWAMSPLPGSGRLTRRTLNLAAGCCVLVLVAALTSMLAWIVTGSP